MKTRVVRIGISQEIRIYKPILEAAGLQGEVELTATPGLLLIRPSCRPRAGWAEAFQEKAKHGDDTPFTDMPPILSEWDKEEWEW